MDRRLRSRELWALMLSPFVSQKLSALVSTKNAKDLLDLTELIEAGKITPVIEKAYPLSDAVEAVRRLAESHARGSSSSPSRRT